MPGGCGGPFQGYPLYTNSAEGGLDREVPPDPVQGSLDTASELALRILWDLGVEAAWPSGCVET